jgi:hypothetical protein
MKLIFDINKETGVVTRTFEDISVLETLGFLTGELDLIRHDYVSQILAAFDERVKDGRI